MNIQKVVSAIVNGDLDDDFDTIYQVIRQRRESLAAVKRASFSVGDRVRFTDDVRPAYLGGQVGTIRKLLPKNVVVDLDQRARRFHLGIRTPVEMLELVEEPINAGT